MAAAAMAKEVPPGVDVPHTQAVQAGFSESAARHLIELLTVRDQYIIRLTSQIDALEQNVNNKIEELGKEDIRRDERFKIRTEKLEEQLREYQDKAKDQAEELRKLTEEYQNFKDRAPEDRRPEREKGEKKRTQPEKPFDGSSHSWCDYEWRMGNHMESTFPKEGGSFMKWIGQQDTKLSKEDCNKWGFKNAEAMDGEVWVQITRITGDEPTTLIRAASLDQTCGAEAWRVLKQTYDQQSRIALDTIRTEVFSVTRCKKLEDLTAHLAQWEIKLHRLDTLLVAHGKDPIGDDDKSMLLKDMIPAETEAELEKHEDIHTDLTYSACREFVLKKAKRAQAKNSKNVKGESIRQLQSQIAQEEELETNQDLTTENMRYVQESIQALMKGWNQGKGKGKANGGKRSGGNDYQGGGKKGGGKKGGGNDFQHGGKGGENSNPWGENSKGGGKSQAKGSGAKGGENFRGLPPNKPFYGYCDECGGWGHSKRYCPSAIRLLEDQEHHQPEEEHEEELCRLAEVEEEEHLRTLEQEVDHEDLVNWQGQNYLEIEAEVDTGSCTTIMPNKVCQHIETKPSPGSKNGKKYRTAGKETINNDGQSMVHFWTPEGERRRMLWQRGNVNKCLAGGGAMADKGNTLIFNKWGGALS